MYSGLSSSKAQELLQQEGFNEIPEKHPSIFSKILKNFLSPIAIMLMIAAILSFITNKAFDGYFILLLVILNVAITIWQENKADNAIKKLNEHLAQKTKVLRDGAWVFIESRMLVGGDVIQLSSGELIPADGKALEVNNVSVNESALTGESLPKDKNVGDSMYSGSFLATGIAIVKITATGQNTNFGKTIFSVERIRKKSLLEKDIINISKFLTVLSIIAVVILSIIFLLEKVPVLELLTLDLSLVIAGIPISLPTVMTLIIELGVLELAGKNVIVRRLSALQDLANVNYLLTDKTGTLTINKINVKDVYAYDGFTHNDVLEYASVLAEMDSENPINSAILENVKDLNIKPFEYKKLKFIPADSKRKRSTLFLQRNAKDSVITVGAPQIVEGLCLMESGVKEKYEREVDTLAANGFRTLAVAVSETTEKEEKMKIIGLIALSDTLRDDAKSVVEFLMQNNIGVSMVTGDNRAIAAQIAKELSLKQGRVITKEELDKMDWDKIKRDLYDNTGAFAEILPEDKLKLVQKANKFFIVAANGDGVNDLPAIKAANVGIAVKNAVSSLKATADIVLLSQGISVIRDAIIESRKIFERLYTYSLYRISESLRLIVTILILGVLYKVYPMTPLQIILIALLNDIPIITLAFDRVSITNRPAKINIRERFTLSSLFGLTGVMESLLLFFIAANIWHLSWGSIQTMYFLKLTVSGHMLIYVAHTKKRWFRFLPSKEVILATSMTQAIATLLAFTGFLMSSHIAISLILFVWIWAAIWMQVGEFMKSVNRFIFSHAKANVTNQG